MRSPLLGIAAVVILAGCRGERPPRDYQNNPPAMTHPATTSSETPSAHGMPGAAPEPNSAAEGKNVARQPTSPVPPTPGTIQNAPATTATAPELGPPADNSQHVTQTTSTAATGTHLATPP